jgi:sedoheptulose-bisphosphatase
MLASGLHPLATAMLPSASLLPVALLIAPGVPPTHPAAGRVWKRGGTAPRACAHSQVTLDSWLEQQDVSPRVAQVITQLSGACMDVASRIRTASCDSYSCFNEYGDEQIAVDLVAEQLMVDALRECDVIAAVSTPLDPLGCLDPTGCYSEDIDLVEQQVRQQQQRGATFPSAIPPDLDALSVCLDPLDGSSIIDTNFAVGSVFGVWRAPSLLNVTGRGLLAAGTCAYGPRTTFTVGLGRVEGVAEFLLVGECSPSGRWVLANTYRSIDEGRLFAPGNLRAVSEHPGYAKLIHYWQQNRYQLRYTGGMVSAQDLFVSGSLPFLLKPHNLELLAAEPVSAALHGGHGECPGSLRFRFPFFPVVARNLELLAAEPVSAALHGRHGEHACWRLFAFLFSICHHLNR